MKNRVLLLKTVFSILCFTLLISAAEVKYAGARSSDYGINPFPSTQEWGNVMQNMASYFPGAVPTGIWIVGTIQGNNSAPTDITLDNVTINESIAGAFIGFVAVIDPDSGDVHTFSIDDNRFVIVDDQLKLKEGEALDYESGSSVTIEITATDLGGLSYSKQFTITVADINEAPTNIILNNQNVNENQLGAVVGQITVTDQDAGDNHTLSVDDSRFEFSSNTLKLKDSEKLLYANEQSVDLQITAADDGGLQMS